MDVDENVVNKIYDLAKYVYDIEKEEFRKALKKIHIHEIVKRVGIVSSSIVDNDSKKVIENEMEKIISKSNSKWRQVALSKKSEMELVNNKETVNGIFVDEIDHDQFDMSPILNEKNIIGKNKPKDKLLNDVRDAVFHFASMDTNTEDLSPDIYSITSMAISIGMKKGRCDYVEPYKVKKKRDEKLKSKSLTKEQLKKQWGYDEHDDIYDIL
jgi:hypothetical protein